MARPSPCPPISGTSGRITRHWPRRTDRTCGREEEPSASDLLSMSFDRTEGLGCDGVVRGRIIT